MTTMKQNMNGFVLTQGMTSSKRNTGRNHSTPRLNVQYLVLKNIFALRGHLQPAAGAAWYGKRLRQRKSLDVTGKHF